MHIFNFPIKNKKVILALGAESAGNFSVYTPLPLYSGGDVRYSGQRGFLHFSQDFGDLLNEENFAKFKKAVMTFLKKENLTPDVILTDLHPLMKTTLWGEMLAKKYQAQHIQVQHHHAHIFSAIGECFSPSPVLRQRLGCISPSPVLRGGLGRGCGAEGFQEIPHTFYGIAIDGTGYGEDEKIWGGEVFKVTSIPSPPVLRGRCPVLRTEGVHVERIGHLENQMMIGGELAIREPARVLISILSKFLSKKEVFNFVKKYYSKNEFEVLYNQLQQNFNCAETSSAGRVLDAISLLLGFCNNERKYKHAPIDLLEKNSTEPYPDLKPKIVRDENGKFILDTSYLFNYVISALGGSASGGNYLHKKDKRRLAATAQLYIAQGLYEITKKYNNDPLPCNQGRAGEGLRDDFKLFLSGGLANNKIISDYLLSKGVYTNKKVYPVNSNEFSGIPRGDAGLSFGQIVYYLLQN